MGIFKYCAIHRVIINTTSKRLEMVCSTGLRVNENETSFIIVKMLNLGRTTVNNFRFERVHLFRYKDVNTNSSSDVHNEINEQIA